VVTLVSSWYDTISGGIIRSNWPHVLLINCASCWDFCLCICVETIWVYTISLQISRTRFLLRGVGFVRPKICIRKKIYNNNKINIWRNKIANSDISNYTWVLKFEDWILKTKNCFRKEVIEKFSIQPNGYAYH
jgi:hypothetical protein